MSTIKICVKTLSQAPTPLVNENLPPAGFPRLASTSDTVALQQNTRKRKLYSFADVLDESDLEALKHRFHLVDQEDVFEMYVEKMDAYDFAWALYDTKCKPQLVLAKNRKDSYPSIFVSTFGGARQHES